MFRGGSPASGASGITSGSIDGLTGVFRTYNGAVDATNYERGFVQWISNVLTIGTEAGGTGTARQLTFSTPANIAMNFSPNGSLRWQFQSSTSHLVCAADNSYDIGATGATRPRSLYLASLAQVAQAVAVPAGGSAAAFLGLSSTAALGVYFGSGLPTVSAAQGSLYIRTDGSSTSTRLYVNTNGTTGWTNVTTAA